MSELKYGWIAFDRIWGVNEAVETEQWAREQAEEWLENYRGEYLDNSHSPWPMGMEGKIGYGEIIVKATAKPSGDNDYQIIKLAQPAGKVKA